MPSDKTPLRPLQDANLFRRAELVLIAIGCFLRLVPTLAFGLDVPTSEGALYLFFGELIYQNNLIIPSDVPYFSAGGIPFGYMPLPFYLSGFLTEVLTLDPVFTGNVLPLLFSLSAFPVVLSIIRHLGLNKYERLFAIAGFSVLGMFYGEFVETAGLAEGPGLVATLLFIRYFFLKDRHDRRSWILAGGLFAVCVMTSPGSAMAGVFLFLTKGLSLVVRFLFPKLRSGLLLLMSKVEALRPLSAKLSVPSNTPEESFREWFRKSAAPIFLIGIAGVIFSIPYWVPVFWNHGLGLFIEVATTQSNAFSPTAALGFQKFPSFNSGLGHLSIVNLAVLIGLVYAMSQRKFLLLVMGYLALTFIPREDWASFAFVWIFFGMGVPRLVSLAASSKLGRWLAAPVVLLLLSLSAFSDIERNAFDRYSEKRYAAYWKDYEDAVSWIR